MKPLLVEIIAYAPTQYFYCQHCEMAWKAAEVDGVKTFHDDMLKSSLPSNMMQDYIALSGWVLNAVERYGGRVVFKVIDAVSMEGLFKTLRFGIRKYPTLVIAGKEKVTAAPWGEVEMRIDRLLAQEPV